jgi:uncharacterized tellurite resistance protein B-like protein
MGKSARSFWNWLGVASDAPDEGSSLEEIEAALAGLGTERARHLACFAYILTRPARADHEVTDGEAARMREIVMREARISEPEAAAIVRVAREVARTSGGTEDFLITREFERSATRDEKLHLLDCLFEIGAADASILVIEDNEIRRVASELKLDHADFINVRRKHLEHFEVLKRRNTANP